MKKEPVEAPSFKVAICIPSHETVCYPFANALAQLALFTAAHIDVGVEVGIQSKVGTYVHQARIDLALAAARANVDVILWLDSDMTFPRDVLFRLMKRMQENPHADVIGINYAKRGLPTDYVAIKEVGIPGEKLATTADSTGIEEVEAMGFGCVLMKAEVLTHLPDPIETPWFQNKYLGDHIWMGEDVFFCDLLRKAGVKLYVDHDLSKMCTHVGLFDYELAHVDVLAEATV